MLDRTISRKRQPRQATGPIVFPPFQLYPQQKEILELMESSSHFASERYRELGVDPSGKTGPRNFILNCHRQWGKDIVTAVFCVKKCLQYPGTTVYYLFPTLQQAKRVWFENNTGIPSCPRLWNLIPKSRLKGGTYKKTTGVIEFNNGSIIHLGGMQVGSVRSPGSGARGAGLHIVVYSEYASNDINPQVATIYEGMGLPKKHISIYPTTSNGRNHFYRIIKPYLDEETCTEPDKDNWAIFQLNIEQTFNNRGERIVTDEDYRSFVRKNNEMLGRQEYYNDFSASGTGSVFSADLERARQRNAILPAIVVQPHLPTFTGWDYGVNNATVVVYAQLDRGVLNIIQAKSYRRTNLYEVAREVLQWQKDHHIPGFQAHYVSHDFGNKDYHAKGFIQPQPRSHILMDAGLRNIRRVARPKDKVDVAVSAVKACFPYMRFSQFRCEKLLESLENYSFFYDSFEQRFDERSILKDKMTDESDYNDALQSLCIPMQRILSRSDLSEELLQESERQLEESQFLYNEPASGQNYGYGWIPKRDRQDSLRQDLLLPEAHHYR